MNVIRSSNMIFRFPVDHIGLSVGHFRGLGPKYPKVGSYLHLFLPHSFTEAPRGPGLALGAAETERNRVGWRKPDMALHLPNILVSVMMEKH